MCIVIVCSLEMLVLCPFCSAKCFLFSLVRLQVAKVCQQIASQLLLGSGKLCSYCKAITISQMKLMASSIYVTFDIWVFPLWTNIWCGFSVQIYCAPFFMWVFVALKSPPDYVISRFESSKSYLFSVCMCCAYVIWNQIHRHISELYNVAHKFQASNIENFALYIELYV